MQTQAVSNTKSNVKFQSRSDFKNASNFVNMSDTQLQELAYASTDKSQDKKAHRAMTATFIAMPIIDSIASGVLAQNSVEASGKFTLKEIETGIESALESKVRIKLPVSLSERLGATGKRAGGWALALAAVGIYSAIKHQFVKNSPDSQQFGQEHPILSFAGDIAVILGACWLGAKGINKLPKILEKKYPKSAEELQSKLAKWSERIDNKEFNTKTLPKMEKWFEELGENHPLVAKSGKFLLSNSALILLGVGIVQLISYSKNKIEAVEQNYQGLRSAQLATAKHMVSSLTVQKDVLAQSQPQLASDLEKAINGEKPVSQKELKEFKKAAKVYEDEKIRIKARQDESAKQDSEPEVVNDIQIIKVIYIPDKKD